MMLHRLVSLRELRCYTNRNAPFRGQNLCVLTSICTAAGTRCKDFANIVCEPSSTRQNGAVIVAEPMGRKGFRGALGLAGMLPRGILIPSSPVRRPMLLQSPVRAVPTRASTC